MKYVSEITGKTYNTSKECIDAEREYEKKRTAELEAKEKKAAERKARAAEVDEARKAMLAAQSKYREVLESFIKDYNTYHYSTSDIKEIPTLFSIFNPLLFDI